VFRFPPLTPVVRVLLIVFVIGYVWLLIASNWLGVPTLPFDLALVMNGPFLDGGLAATLGFHADTPAFRIPNLWQVATYVLGADTSPRGVLPFIVQVVFFWLVVSPFELAFGKRRTIQVLVLSLFCGSAPALLFGLGLGGYLMGFSTLILGPLAAYVWMLRIKDQDANFFGVMQMKPAMMIGVVLFLSLLFFLASRNFMELVADLGATAGGIVFMERMSRPPKRKRKQSGGRKRPAGFRVIEGGKGDDDEPRWLN